ncbi:MAG: hypothetical protein Q7T87_19115 [Polaromonas sp.]|nr:hypothetical protein [Polaromonas sp.]
MFTVALAVKLIAEIALAALAGQWLLGLVCGAARGRNPFYRVLQVLGHPFVRAARVLTPAAVADRHVPLVAFVLLLSAWLAATIFKVQACLQMGVDLCR